MLLAPKGAGGLDEEADTDDTETETSDYDDAFADVADLLDVPSEKREALGLALKRAVMACMGEE